jgi:hypothetical protein
MSWMAICVALWMGGCSGSDTSDDTTTVSDDTLAQINDFTYLGAFRIASNDFGVSNTNYAIGTLAYNPDHHSIYIAGHDHHRAIAEFSIPELVISDDLQALEVVESPLQEFVYLLESSPNGNPEGLNRITGLLYIDGQLIINVENWYDAGGANRDTSLLVRTADNLSTSEVDGYFELEGAAQAAGYMSQIPETWRESFGGSFLTGWSSVYSIISRYSVGPSLFVFDPRDMLEESPGSQAPVATIEFMNFAYGGGHYLAPDALQTQEGSAPALWNFLSRAVYAFIVPGTRTFAVFGSSGGIHSGIGYKITQDNGNLCGGYCAYNAEDYYNYYWLFDVQEIIDAPDPYDIEPYAHGAWSVPFDDNGAHRIIGGTFDDGNGILYLCLSSAGQVGTYDRPPLIVAYRIPQ